ncbi:MAG: CinA family protein [Nocardioides sp.]
MRVATPLAESVHDLLKGRRETVATAESLSGGRLAALLGGVVSRATEAKATCIQPEDAYGSAGDPGS